VDTALSARFVPGSNLKGDVVGANWRFLLPSLELERVVVVGDVGPSTRAALGQRGAEIVGEHEARLLPPGSVDLVVVERASRLERDPALQGELARLLSPAGLVWLELRRPHARLDGGLAQLASYRLAPPRGEIQGAAPAGDPAAVRFLRRLAKDDSGVRRKPPERVRRALQRHALYEAARPRYGVLAGPAGSADASVAKLPAYVRAAAAEAGVGVDGQRFALATPGRYSSKKALLFVFDEGERPHAVVKLTRDPIFSERLENEYRALALLEERGAAVRQRPRPLFRGRHAGLTLVGETVVEGIPLARAGATSSSFTAGLEFLADLGEATADEHAARPAQVAGALGELLEQWAEIYDATDAERAFLADQVSMIASAQALPLVFQHGDPGSWNALVTPAGTIAFLDWEAAAREGLPLWDILYFARSYGTLTGRGPSGLLDDTALRDTVGATIERHRSAIGLAPELVEPLFYTCWMHRALKEATRLRPDDLQRSHYATFLRRCIERRAEPRLRALLSPHGTG
jgi:hypothetical protein